MVTALFANSKDAVLRSCATMIEDLLVSRGAFLNQCRLETGASQRAWVARLTANPVYYLLRESDVITLRMSAVVMRMNATSKREALCSSLLTQNMRLTEAAFAIAGDFVLLSVERPAVDLDRRDLLRTTLALEQFADTWDDKLCKEYGGDPGGVLPRDFTS